MRKYIETFRLSFKMQIVWRFDAAMTMFATFARILSAWILWQAVFSANTFIKGLDFSAILSYYIICSILSSIDFSHQISGEVSELIRSGRFSGHMVTPVNPLFFFGSMTAGQSAFHFSFSFISAVICALLFRINMVITSDIVSIILAAAIIPAALAFMACYHYFIGILTFKFLEIDFFLHLQGNIIAFVTGALVPLSLLPGSVLYVLRFLPFTHVVYTPAMLLCGQINAEEGLFALVIITLWTVIMFLITQGAYKNLRVKYDGVGI